MRQFYEFLSNFVLTNVPADSVASLGAKQFPSYLHNEISYTDKTASLYWIRGLGETYQWCSHLQFASFHMAAAEATESRQHDLCSE